MLVRSLPAFRPWRGSPGPIAQTVLGARAGAPLLEPAHGFDPVQVPLRDGGSLEGRYRAGTGRASVLMMHGLGGSLESGYLRRAGHEAARQGLGVLALAHRGSGGALERSSRPYMTGHTSDVEDAARWLRGRPGCGRLLALGFSLSGNTLLKWLGQGGDELPDAALAVAPPIDLDSASRHLARWPARGLELWVLAACRRWIPRLQGEAPPVNPYRVGATQSFREFDRDYITPVWGFPDRDAYYASASARAYAEGIRTPTLIVAADDDPMAPAEDLATARWGPGVRLALTRGGGHLGWIGHGPGGRPQRWLDRALRAAFRTVQGAPAPALPTPLRAQEALAPCSTP